MQIRFSGNLAPVAPGRANRQAAPASRPQSGAMGDSVSIRFGQNTRKDTKFLLRAVETGDTIKIKQMAAAGVDLDEVWEEKQKNALHYACREGHMDSARALLEAGANINALSDAEYGDSALTCAVRGGHYDIAHMLIEAGADLEAGGQDIGGALSSAAFGPQAPENAEQHRHLLRTLIARGADKNAQDNYFNWTPLYCAALGDYVDGVNILLEAGADINLADSHGNAPVYTAAQKGHTEIVQLLIDAGADMSVLSKESYIQPLNDIVEKGDTDMLKILLDAGAMPRVEAGFRKLNPLHIAAQKGDWEAAELLIKADRKLMFMEDRHGRRPYQHVKKNRKLKHLLKP